MYIHYDIYFTLTKCGGAGVHTLKRSSDQNGNTPGSDEVHALLAFASNMVLGSALMITY